MIYFNGLALKHLNQWDIPDDTPRFSSVEDCYRMFLGMHFRMLRAGNGNVDPNYTRYLACVEYFESRMRLSYVEFRNAVATIVALYKQYFEDPDGKKSQAVLDAIGKFERLVYLFNNKTFPSRSSV